MSESEVNKLIKKRSNIKARLTLFSKYFSNFKETMSATTLKEMDKQIILELEMRVEKLTEISREFEDVQKEIELVTDDIENQILEREALETRFFALTAGAKKIISEYNSQMPSTSGITLQSSSGSSVVTNFENAQMAPSIKLPQINLPKFSGLYEDWLEFRDTFDSLIHSNNSISDIQKFHYLRASLVAGAAQVIRSIEFSATNYTVAWDILLQRYNNTNILVYNHVKNICELPSLSRESAADLRKMLDNVCKHLRSLQTMEQPVEYWDTLLIYILAQKLDKITAREWELYKSKLDTSNSLVATLQDFKVFIKQRADFLETISSKKETKYNPQTFHMTSKVNTPSNMLSPGNKMSCTFCKRSNHFIQNCPDFNKLPSGERIQQLAIRKLCINCLRGSHPLRNCLASHCKKCSQKHNTLLHNDFRVNTNPRENTEVVTPSNTSGAGNTEPGSFTASSFNANVLLSTALVQVKNSLGIAHTCRVLLDSASQSHFITADCCKALGLHTLPVNLSVLGINNTLSSITAKCTVSIESLQSSFCTKASCLVIPKINENLPSHPVNVATLGIPKHLKLADPTFDQGGPIDILLGAELFFNLLCIGQIKLGSNLPVLQKSVFGWLISGGIPHTPNPHSYCNLVTNSDLHSLISRFWEIEEPVQRVFPLSTDEQRCEDIFQRTTHRTDEGRFIVQIPLKEDISLLGDSKVNALKRFKSLEYKFTRQREFKCHYSAFMEEYISLGHMKKVDSSSTTQHRFFFPHHGVMNEQSQTTKLRVVFDGSAQSESGVSFNDLQYIGPTIQDDLFAILLRFRQGRIVVCADIVKMYRQILVEESQRHLQTILWRSDPYKEIDSYQLQTVTYGTASAPWLAVRCLKQLSLEFSSTFPRASQIIAKDFYMDDLLTSCDSEEEAVKICGEVSFILAQACFKLQKWASNSEIVLQQVKARNPTAILKLGENEKTKTLGLYWSCASDNLMYTINSPTFSKPVTKRNILAEIAQIFDPLGLLSPSIVLAKIMLQQLWLHKLNWDESLPSDLDTRWREFRQQLPQLNALRIPRHILCPAASYVEIHGFSDASMEAYGACIYLRSISNYGKITVRLLCAKTKVAPLKSLTIPKLELCGALLLAQLMRRVKISMSINFKSAFLWCDSTVCLCWIRTQPNCLQTFVQNRVAQIQNITQPSDWNYISTKENPADLLSRGMLPRELTNSSLWFYGPEFLLKEREFWPKCKFQAPKDIPETRNHKFAHHTTANYSSIDLTKYSSLNKLRRIFGYCFRFVSNCKSEPTKRNFGPLSAIELHGALLCLVKISQAESFPADLSILQRNMPLPKKSKLLSLNPFVDANNIIRVGGRLQLANFSYEKKHPAILDGKHHLTKLIFAQEHLRLFHAGPQQLLFSVREQFWPLSGRNLAKKTVHSCIRCFRFKSSQLSPIMGILPKHRVNPAPPFHITGMDYAGPILIKNKQGRGAKVTKAYISLFICFTTKAVHLELVSDLTTSAFIAAFRRFTARRGKPLEVYSDNGTNYVGAHSELLELSNFLRANEPDLQESLCNTGVNWHFIPAFSPHFGGIWEAGVKAAKNHLRRVLGDIKLTFEELYTILSEIEAILNSRPITPFSSDPNDLSALTPSHFLIGRPATALPDPDLRDLPGSRLSRFQLLQQMQQHFWQRWSKEFISELQVRTKWKTNQSNLQVGSLVVIKADNTPPFRWQLARIIQLHPGPDGIARVATLKTFRGTVKRSFAKICVLPIELKETVVTALNKDTERECV